MNEEDIIRNYFSRLGKQSSEKLTEAQRKERGQKAIKARWDRYRQAGN